MNARSLAAVLLALSTLSLGAGCLGDESCDADESCEGDEGDDGLGESSAAISAGIDPELAAAAQQQREWAAAKALCQQEGRLWDLSAHSCTEHCAAGYAYSKFAGKCSFLGDPRVAADKALCAHNGMIYDPAKAGQNFPCSPAIGTGSVPGTGTTPSIGDPGAMVILCNFPGMETLSSCQAFADVPGWVW